MPPTTTTSPTPSVPIGPLAHFLAHPDAWWADLGRHLAHLGEAVLPTAVAVLAGLTALVVAWVLVRAIGRLRAPAAGQLVEVSLPASVEPKGAFAFWRNLHPVLAGRSRLLHPPRHVAFEIETSDAGIRLRLWTAAGVPAPAVARAVGSAWPGAQCQVRDASGPLLSGPLVSCGELRLGGPAWLPLGTDHGVDPLRAVLGALYVDAVGEHAVVQVLARPARNRRAAVIGRAARSLPTGRPIALVPRLLAAWRTTPPTPMRPDPMRSADARHALDKAIDLPAFEVVVRFGVSAHGSGRAARRRLRARVHELTAAFGVYAGRNHLVPRRGHGCRRHLDRRAMGRGQVLGLSELAALAHLPQDEMVPGLAYAAAAAVAPPPHRAWCRGPGSEQSGRTTMTGSEHTTHAAGLRVIGETQVGPRRAVALAVEDGRFHSHVVGATGSGKSTLLANLALADMNAGRGVVMVDPKGDTVTDVLARLPRHALERLVLIDPMETEAPASLNVLDAEPAEVAVDHVVSVFARIFSPWWGPRTEDVLRSACATLRRLSGATLAEIPVLLTDRAWRAPLVSSLSERSGLKGFWDAYDALSPAGQAQVIGPIMNKLRAVLSRRFARDLFGSATSSFDMKDILDGGILLARLPKGTLGEETARLVGALLVARVWQAATARAERSIRPDATLYVDEWQNSTEMVLHLSAVGES